MLESLGLFGLFIGCLLAATIVPFSSEALMAGAMLLDYNLWVIVLVAALGNTAGGMISFLMGWFCKWEWLEKWFKVKREKLMSVHDRVGKYGLWAALLTWMPVVGDLIAIAMGLLRLIPWWTMLLMFMGKLGRYIVAVSILGFTGLF